MARRYYGHYPMRRPRRNPRRPSMGTLALVGAGALALTSASVRNALGGAFGGFFHSVGTDVHGAIPAPTPAGSGGVITSVAVGDLHALSALAQSNGITDPTSAAANPYGQTVWAWQHGGDPSGYNGLPGAQRASWNSYAIHGQ